MTRFVLRQRIQLRSGSVRPSSQEVSVIQYRVTDEVPTGQEEHDAQNHEPVQNEIGKLDPLAILHIPIAVQKEGGQNIAVCDFISSKV